jgi:hypothetical protein
LIQALKSMFLGRAFGLLCLLGAVVAMVLLCILPDGLFLGMAGTILLSQLIMLPVSILGCYLLRRL